MEFSFRSDLKLEEPSLHWAIPITMFKVMGLWSNAEQTASKILLSLGYLILIVPFVLQFWTLEIISFLNGHTLLIYGILGRSPPA